MRTCNYDPGFGCAFPVAAGLDHLAAGVSAGELHADYPTLPKEAIPAALAYAADLARDTIVPISAA
jgi:uncharacterized protein (DUF433 family)